MTSFTQLWCHNCPEPQLHSAPMSQLAMPIWSCTFGYKAVLSNLIYGHKWGMPSPNMGILYSYDISNLHMGTRIWAQMGHAQIWVIYGHKWGMPKYGHIACLWHQQSPYMGTKGTMRYAQIWSPNLELTLSTVMSQLSTKTKTRSLQYLVSIYSMEIADVISIQYAHIWACLICSHILYDPYLGMPHLCPYPCTHIWRLLMS